MQLQFPGMPDQLTRSEGRILDYISSNSDEFFLSSIGEVSERLDVSVTTLSRFARHLGFQNYKEFKQSVIQQTSSSGPAAKLAGTLGGEGFSVRGWFLRQQEYLLKTLEGLDEEGFSLAAEAALSARRILIHAKSASASLGQLLLFRLRRLGLSVFLLPSGGSEVLEGLAQADSRDLVIMFSFSKVSKEGRMILDYEKEAGYKTLAFCSRAFIPAEERADIQLFVYRGEEKEYHSMAAPAAAVDALVVAVSQKMGAESSKQLSELHRLKKKYAPDR